MSPLLANIALSVLDKHFTQKWEALGPDWARAKHRRAGNPTMRIVRYADDFVVMVAGTLDDAEALRDEVSNVLAFLPRWQVRDGNIEMFRPQQIAIVRYR